MSVASFANIFSHSNSCLFVSFMISFAMQRKSLVVPFAYFCFYFHYSRNNRSEKIPLWSMSESFLPMFSSKSFIVFSLTFKSLIHFEFSFVYGVREFSNFILLHVAVQFSQHHLLKRLSFHHCIVLPLWS